MEDAASISGTNQEDTERLRLAFQEFMLGGKADTTVKGIAAETSSIASTHHNASKTSKKKKKKKRPSAGASPIKSSDNVEADAGTKGRIDAVLSPSPNKLNQSAKKRYHQLLSSYSNKIRTSWFEIDDQIHSVLENIESIRRRVPKSWKLLRSSECRTTSEYDGTCTQKNSSDDWKYHGYHGKPKEATFSLHLTPADVQLALDHDLEQHEKMIAALRSLVSELAECHDSLGRLVDTLWTFHLDCQIQSIPERDGSPRTGIDDMKLLVNNATQLFKDLSTELYRKQWLISLILTSVTDEILGEDSQGQVISTKYVGAQEGSPVEVARCCCRSWPRRVDERLMEWIGNFGSA